jgi:hypothetical protein
MKRTLLAMILGCLLPLGACAVTYTHQDKPEALWDVDYHMCEVEADYAVTFRHYSTTASRPHTTTFTHYSPRYKEFLRECMEKKGYAYEDDLKKVLF